jgi:hypothetical protein
MVSAYVIDGCAQRTPRRLCSQMDGLIQKLEAAL